MYMATVNLHWLNLTRISYIALGAGLGTSLAVFETRLVLSRLATASEATVWEVFPIGVAMFFAPLLATVSLFGVQEYAPFGLFLFFPSMICLFAVSGYTYSKYENANRVYLFVFPYGFKYWTEPNPKVDDRFRYFLQDIASKDADLIWSHIGYPSRYLNELSKRPDLGDNQTRIALFKLLKIMRRVQVVALTHFVGTMVFSVAFMAVIFSGSSGHSLSNGMLNFLMPLAGAVWIALGVDVFVSMRYIKKKANALFSEINAHSLSSV